MKTLSLSRPRTLFSVVAVVLLTAATGSAQDCNLPALPAAGTTVIQDRDQMLCQLGIKLPVLPPKLEDPNRSPNARPRDPKDPEGNWTDPLGHTIVRSPFGLWITYDDSAGAAGGAMSPLGPYGPTEQLHYTPIDLLKMRGGTPVSTPADWWTKRRPEIIKVFEDDIYGHIPDRSLWPAIAWSVSPVTTGTANDFAYRQKTITGTIDTSGYPAIRNKPVITCTLRTPADKPRAKVPVFIVFGGLNAWQHVARYGYGICGFNPGALQPDGGGANLSSYIIGLVNKGNWRKPGDWGAVGAWAWGIGRLIDYFATDPDVDESRIALEGHSRYGKATMATLVYEPRIRVGYPSSAGSLGTSLARRHFGQNLESMGATEYYWTAGNFFRYMGPLKEGSYMPRKVENLAIDAYSLIAAVAPRAVFINGGTDTPPGRGEAWQDPRGMYLSGVLASPVYEFLGRKGLIVPPGTVFTSGPGESIGGTPPFDTAFISGDIGYRRQHEGHQDAPGWPAFAEFASRYFNANLPVVAASQSFTLGAGNGKAVGTVAATDPDGHQLRNWQITGGTGAAIFALARETGEVTIAKPGSIDFGGAASYSLNVAVDDGINMSRDQTVTIAIPARIDVCHKGRNTPVSKKDVPGHLGHGDTLGRCQ